MRRLLIVSLAVGSLIAALLLVWFGPWALLPADNPPLRHRTAILSMASDSILRRACFDCHSYETDWPWYAHAPLVSVLVRRDVHRARGELNFSAWDRVGIAGHEKVLRAVLEEVRRGEMPPQSYLAANSKARVRLHELQRLFADALESYGPATLGPKAPERY